MSTSTNGQPFSFDPLPLRAGETSVGALFQNRARFKGDAVALIEGDKRMSFGELNARVNRLAHVLAGEGIRRGDRIAILSRNCSAYVEVELASAKLGAMVAAINWRLADPEMVHCIGLADPDLLIVAEDYIDTVNRLNLDVPKTIELGSDYETRLARAASTEPPNEARSEDGLVILYTSGTTGLPKGAVISHRAMIARGMVYLMEYGMSPEEAFVAWAPMFHMASTDHMLAHLLYGAPVVIVDGYDPEAFLRTIEKEYIGWIPLIPGMIEDFLSVVRQQPITPRHVRVIGAMADLVAPHQIAEATEFFQAPYINSFGSTETGIPPASGTLIPVGVAPTDLAKQQSSFCEIRLVDAEDRDVPDGEPGECAIAGPTVFSGYWRAPEVNATDFRGGWFHMGDVFVRTPDGKFYFKDRAKYMIKSGGENIYPAEIERVLLSDGRVDDAVVVRRFDPRWGEVPVAAIARNDDSLQETELLTRCRQELAGYKQPKEIRFVGFDELPRSTTGKIQRHEVENWFNSAEDEGEDS